ncbi:MAG: tRNA (adenosine(37)-N6)-threonylcarbamoyltransferase complex ATPase subunit type 1 TsaE [Acidobacteria bacterium]|nr:tRNA (adenosine(37)-N6)-threonylcarbamoyltransferase complex ATPase subunit type 1 TsaE [Acidobacteriota bacterium]MCZ6768147.1 tRNA (adenosine(37)-N6)-threonylcarbamoyltransferase complex ATPase subunit type 1 TsaE [Acidobacteriota bacterium]
MEIEYSNSEQETLRIGEKIGRELHLPQVILLYGELGSGKTVLVRGLARGLGVQDPTTVHSPSFTLVNQYIGKEGIIYHLDFFRLEGLRDLYSLGLEEILGSHSIVIIEWAEKLLLEAENPMKIRIFLNSKADTRRFEISRCQQARV